MSQEDFYKTLGVSKTASADDIKKAYRKLAMQYHPDKNKGDKEAERKFKEISAAYEILSDQDKRAAYDRMGHAAFNSGGHPGAGGGGFHGFHGGGAGSFSDIFEEMFGDFMGGGGPRGHRTSQRGGDLQYSMQITLEEAYTGIKKTIVVPTNISCDECEGSGAAKGSSAKTCQTCAGHGKVRAQQGFFTVERTCPTCRGIGKFIDKPCAPCSGTGRREQKRKLNVSIPAGIEDGSRIRLAGEGDAGLRGAPAGDLYVFVSIKSHKLFERDGANIHCRVPIDLATAALGGKIDVPTVDGSKARVTIPEGTQSGHQFRLKEKGMSIMRRNTRGDMYVHVAVETPVNLTKRQKELLTEFASSGKSGSKSTSPESDSFLKKVKGFWDNLQD